MNKFSPCSNILYNECIVWCRMFAHTTLFIVGNPRLITHIYPAVIIHGSFERNYVVVVNNSSRIALVQYHLKDGSYGYLYCILLVTRQLFNTTLNGPVSFELRELCVLVLHSAWPDSYLKLLWLVRCIFRTRDMCTCITFCWTRQLFNTTLIGLVAFGRREFCVFVLHSAGSDSYFTLLWLVRGIWRTGDICTCITFCLTRQLFSNTLIRPWHLEDGSYVYLYYILLDQTAI